MMPGRRQRVDHQVDLLAEQRGVVVERLAAENARGLFAALGQLVHRIGHLKALRIAQKVLAMDGIAAAALSQQGNLQLFHGYHCPFLFYIKCLE